MPITRTLITTLAIAAVAVPGAQAQSSHGAAVTRPSWTTLAAPVAPWPATPADDTQAPVIEAGSDIDWAMLLIGGVVAMLVVMGAASLALGARHSVRVRSS